VLNRLLNRRRALLTLSGLTFSPLLQGQAASRLPNRPTRKGKLPVRARRRIEAGGELRIEQTDAAWKVSESAIIVCDMWDQHWCRSASRRVGDFAPRMNEVVKAARALGVQIIHAPSSTMDFYAGTPQRRRMIEAPYTEPPVKIQRWCYLEPEKEVRLPIDDSDGGCDDPGDTKSYTAWKRQHPAIEIAEYDGVSDNGQEIYNLFEELGIKNVVMMGVHTNMCVLGRPFGIRQLTKLGKNVVLARDLTDAMYDPRDFPYVSHKRGTEMVVEHIERYWCPTIDSGDLVQTRATPVLRTSVGPSSDN
jgi:nicotinamidase-related amidase